jgi:polygalacturonase
VCDAKAYGAKADGHTKDTQAIQRAIDACTMKGGGTVRLTGGTFLTGPIVLKSHITLEVDKGATLLGSQDMSDYHEAEELREPSVQPLIGAKDASYITIRGGGTIDGAGQPWWAAVRSHDKSKFAADRRPRLILLDHCHHVLIENVTIQNSASWQVVPYYSDDVTIRNGKILAPSRSPNTDGIDPFASTHVTISHMYIDVGDDNVAIKSGQPRSPGSDSPSAYIRVTNCTFLHGHGLSIGSEIAGGVHNVYASNIRFEGTRNGVRVKSGRDRGGDIGNFVFKNLTMTNVENPFIVTAYYSRNANPYAPAPITRLTPHFHNITVENLTATGAKQAALIEALPETPLTSIALDNVHIGAKKGMTIRNATVTMHDVTIKAGQGKPITLLENAKVVKK